MTVQDIMPESDWRKTQEIARIYNVPPELLAAIGWHETHWGQLGAGRQGWYLGYGYYPGSTVKEQYRGLVPQLQGAARQIAGFFQGQELTWENWQRFAEQSWRPGNPEAWARSTWSIFQSLQGKPGEVIGGPGPGAGQVKAAGTKVNPAIIAGGAVILALVLAAGVALMVVGGTRNA